MENETQANNGFKIENCRARVRGTIGLVDCLSPKQAIFCGSSSPFGIGYLCHHLSRNKILENTKRNMLHHPSDSSQSDNTENDSHTGITFDIENCRAENNIKDWVDCLSPMRASICGFSTHCGNGYSCEHLYRFKIVANTTNLRNNSILPLIDSQPDNL